MKKAGTVLPGDFSDQRASYLEHVLELFFLALLVGAEGRDAFVEVEWDPCRNFEIKFLRVGHVDRVEHCVPGGRKNFHELWRDVRDFAFLCFLQDDFQVDAYSWRDT